MNNSPSHPSDGPDVLIWRMAADSIHLAVMTAGNLVRASLVHPDAHMPAQQRVNSLSDMAATLIRAASEMQDRLDGVGDHAEFDRIVDGFWDASGDADTDEVA